VIYIAVQIAIIILHIAL